jgi:hypothetical protein
VRGCHGGGWIRQVEGTVSNSFSKCFLENRVVLVFVVLSSLQCPCLLEVLVVCLEYLLCSPISQPNQYSDLRLQNVNVLGLYLFDYTFSNDFLCDGSLEQFADWKILWFGNGNAGQGAADSGLSGTEEVGCAAFGLGSYVCLVVRRKKYI